MKRVTSDDERKLFERNFKEARPIKVTMPKAPTKKKSANAGPAGVNGATQDRLRKGRVEPDGRIDLHGMTESVAHRTLHTWLMAAHGRGYRLVLVITGKGNPRKDESTSWMQSPHGILKQMVPRWLNEPELKALIASTSQAHVRHGGDGALYVYLRKAR